ncbi:rhodanese-like domain-containing protein [Aestuariivivens sp. NBU2969]|uniref:rhodanese-like domain-containing protein n=1 Tax=Aestuariivivens sp. NBU2969 TaxID=2873267 RepID=UPI001CBD7F9F|nr:rhodanese-like domain-containing protein [Aestuariivivens sp. NBU2969]
MRLVLFLFGLMVFVGCKQPTASQTKIVTQEEMEALLQNKGVQLVDVRTPEEYSEGFIPGAINIDFLSPTFLEDIESLDKEKPIIVYCQSGGRSGKCSKKLEEAGFKKIYDLQGGYSKWKYKGPDAETK